MLVLLDGGGAVLAEVDGWGFVAVGWGFAFVVALVCRPEVVVVDFVALFFFFADVASFLASFFFSMSSFFFAASCISLMFLSPEISYNFLAGLRFRVAEGFGVILAMASRIPSAMLGAIGLSGTHMTDFEDLA